MSDYKIGDTPGYEGPRPYRPANGTEGQIFMEQFCFQCLYESKESPPYYQPNHDARRR